MILGVGTLALDAVETPAGSVRDVPGGSALYFGAAASRALPAEAPEEASRSVALAGVTGDDFPEGPLDALAARGVDVSGVARAAEPTFRWRARYDQAGRREVLSVHRGAIVRRVPEIPGRLRTPSLLFLGSMDPSLQRACLDQVEGAATVVLDTMARWIRDRRARVEALLPDVDVLLVNEEEVHLLGGAEGEGLAVGRLRALGVAWVVVKRGARGSCAHGPGGVRVEVAASEVAEVVDPTGAGDAFAGGLAVRLAEAGALTADRMRAALTLGAEMGGRAVAAFSIRGLLEADGVAGPRAPGVRGARGGAGSRDAVLRPAAVSPRRSSSRPAPG